MSKTIQSSEPVKALSVPGMMAVGSDVMEAATKKIGIVRNAGKLEHRNTQAYFRT
jgi:hypothetical protein